MAPLDSATQSRGWYRDGLRGWIDEVQSIGELLHVNGAHWDVEMGSITHACIPYDMKLKRTFPTVVDVSDDLRAKLRAKFLHIFPPM